MVATSLGPTPFGLALAWHVCLPVIAFPLALVLMGFLDEREWQLLRRSVRRYAPLVS